MLEYDNPLIYPKPSDITLPENCVVRPVISPTPPLDFVLPDNVCSTLLATYSTFSNKMERVDNRGLRNVCQTPIYRIRNYDINFAKYLSDALATYLPAQLVFNERSRVDWQSDNPDNLNVWNLIGVAPYFRYLQYNSGSEHMPHYDTSHKVPEDLLTRTLYSGIIYLTDNDTGATAFIDDEQHKIPYVHRNHDDWEQQATFDQIYSWALPRRGHIIVFPHGECHSVMPNYSGSARKIIRFDIYYSAYTKI